MLIYETLVLLHCQPHTHAAKVESNSNIDIGCKFTIARINLLDSVSLDSSDEKGFGRGSR